MIHSTTYNIVSKTQQNGRSRCSVITPKVFYHSLSCSKKTEVKNGQILTDENAWKKVYVSFHFVPEPDGPPQQFWWVRPDCRLLRDLVDALVAMARRHPQDSDFRRQVLIALGIALHSYADTWAHAGFSGRWSARDNDIEDLHVARRYGDQETGVMPDIGHMEAGGWVDRPEAELSFRFCQANGARPARVERQNPVFFTHAADGIFRRLSGGAPLPDSLRDFLFAAFCMDAEPAERARHIEAQVNADPDSPPSRLCPGLRIPPYNRNLWLSGILRPPASLEGAMHFEYRPTSPWFQFQFAALAQRNLIHGMTG